MGTSLRHSVLLGAALLSVGLLGACTGEDAVSPDAGTIVVVNTTKYDVTGLRISSCSFSTWGKSRGGIDAGKTRSWQVDPGCYDLRAEWEGAAPYDATESGDFIVEPYGTITWDPAELRPNR